MTCCTVNSTHTHTCVHVFRYLFACIIVLGNGTSHLYIECNFVLMYVLLMYMYNDIIIMYIYQWYIYIKQLMLSDIMIYYCIVNN